MTPQSEETTHGTFGESQSMTSSPDNDRKALCQGLAMGLLAAAFFSVTFVLNRKMSIASGHWAWSTSLRFLIMLPPLAVMITVRGQWRELIACWRISPLGWIAWGTLGSAVFYGALTAACAVSPAWVVAATWPIAIVIGILLGPLIYRGERAKIPRRALLFSIVILAGIALLQTGQLRSGPPANVALGLVLVLLSATAHPIGNRKSMMIFENAGIRTNAIVRLTLSIIGALPAILILCIWGGLEAGPPPAAQLETIALVAAAGLVATPLFFAATDHVNRTPSSLAAVEATQAAELVFTLILEAVILGIRLPGFWGSIGLTIILTGILLHALPENSRVQARLAGWNKRRRTRRALPLE